MSDLKDGWSEETRWAMTIVDRALAQLRQLYEAKGKTEQFEAFKKYLTTESTDGEYDVLAARFGMQNKAVAVAVSRLKRRFRELVQQELESTPPDKEDLEEEYRYLIEILRR